MTDHVADALRLRAWALQVLSTGWVAPPDVEARAWRTFLKAERCAVALSSRAEGEAPVVLHAAATLELQRVLSARGQLERLGTIALGLGTRVAVLKGGLHTLSSRCPLDVDDVDVLAEPGHVESIAAALDHDGYRTAGSSGPVHLEPRYSTFAVPVELHFQIREVEPAADVWRRAGPVGEYPGLWQLSPLDHVQHVLWHAVVTHPFRRSVLRDQLLIGEADARLDDAGRRALARRIASHPARFLLERTHDAARRLHDGARSLDPFGVDAAAHYLLIVRRAARLESWFGGPVSHRVFSLLGDQAARALYWRQLWDLGPHSPWGVLEWVGQWQPGAARWIRRGLRILRAPLVHLMAIPVVRRARKLGKAVGG